MQIIAAEMELLKRISRGLKARLPRGVDADDLVNDGYFGLIAARKRFSPRYGVPFERYAARRIRGAMLDGLRSRDWLPRRVREGRQPWVAPTIAIDHSEFVSPHRQVRSLADRETLLALLSALDPVSRRVIRLYYFREMQLKDIGSMLNVSEARISQIRSSALESMRRAVRNAA